MLYIANWVKYFEKIYKHFETMKLNQLWHRKRGKGKYTTNLFCFWL